MRTCGCDATGYVAASVWLLDGNGKEEAAARSELALDPDASTMKLDQLPRDRESETGSVMWTRWGRIHLRELAEDQVMVLGRDANAGVAHFDSQARALIVIGCV